MFVAWRTQGVRFSNVVELNTCEGSSAKLPVLALITDPSRNILLRCGAAAYADFALDAALKPRVWRPMRQYVYSFVGDWRARSNRLVEYVYVRSEAVVSGGILNDSQLTAGMK